MTKFYAKFLFPLSRKNQYADTRTVNFLPLQPGFLSLQVKETCLYVGVDLYHLRTDEKLLRQQQQRVAVLHVQVEVREDNLNYQKTMRVPIVMHIKNNPQNCETVLSNNTKKRNSYLSINSRHEYLQRDACSYFIKSTK